jgi:hypothetical protein
MVRARINEPLDMESSNSRFASLWRLSEKVMVSRSTLSDNCAKSALRID